MSGSIKTLWSRAQVTLAIKIHQDVLGTKDFLNELSIKMSAKLIGMDFPKRKWKERKTLTCPGWKRKSIGLGKRAAWLSWLLSTLWTPMNFFFCSRNLTYFTYLIVHFGFWFLNGNVILISKFAIPCYINCITSVALLPHCTELNKKLRVWPLLRVWTL